MGSSQWLLEQRIDFPLVACFIATDFAMNLWFQLSGRVVGGFDSIESSLGGLSRWLHILEVVFAVKTCASRVSGDVCCLVVLSMITCHISSRLHFFFCRHTIIVVALLAGGVVPIYSTVSLQTCSLLFESFNW